MSGKLYFNDKENRELTERIYELINNAQKCIKTGNFFFKDPKIKNALLNAASRGVAIFVLSNLQGNEERGNIEIRGKNKRHNGRVVKTEDDIRKFENDPHISNLHELYRNGIHVRLCESLHAKFLICDSKEGLIMSANYTIDSLYGNPENGLEIYHNELCDLELIFDTLYMHPDIILSNERDEYRYLESKSPIVPNNLKNIGKTSRLLFTAASDNETENNLKKCSFKTIYEKLVQIIEEAQESLIIVSYSYKEVDKLEELKNALNNAIKRGVKVTLYYGSKWKEQNNKEESNNYYKKSLRSLLGMDFYDLISVREFQNNHAKCMISEHEGALFTANIDGDKGLLKGFELGCVLTEAQRVQSLQRINEIFESQKI